MKSRTNRELKEFILGKKEEWWKRGVNYGIGNCRFCIVWEIEEEIYLWSKVGSNWRGDTGDLCGRYIFDEEIRKWKHAVTRLVKQIDEYDGENWIDKYAE